MTSDDDYRTRLKSYHNGQARIAQEVKMKVRSCSAYQNKAHETRISISINLTGLNNFKTLSQNIPDSGGSRTLLISVAHNIKLNCPLKKTFDSKTFFLKALFPAKTPHISRLPKFDAV